MAELDSGSGGGGTVDDGSTDDSTTGGVFSLPEPLKKFAAHPAAFILGTVLQTLLGGVESMVTAILDAIQYLFVGDSVTSTEGGLGLADIPMAAANILTGAGDLVGSAFLKTLDTVITTMTETAVAFGPLSSIALAVEIGVVLVVLYYAVRTWLRIVIDVIPGGGGLIK